MSLQTQPRRVSVVPVGRAFLLHHLRQIEFLSEQGAYNNGHIQHHHKKQQQSKKESKKKKKSNKKKDDNIEVIIDWDCDLDDYYALLGIKKYEMNISQENLKKACMLCEVSKRE